MISLRRSGISAFIPDGHADLPSHLNNLGTSFSLCFEHTGDLGDISEAIQNHQRAVQLTPDGHADLPSHLNSLGISFSLRFERTGGLDDILEAIQHQERAVQLTPDGAASLPARLNNLGHSFSLRFKATQAHEFLRNAILYYRRSATSSTGPPSLRLNAAKQWAHLSTSHSSLSPSLGSEQLAAHACIIELLSLISGLENTIQSRHQSLLNSSQLSIAAAAAVLSFGHSDKALEWLIQGRCIVWNQINQLRRPLDQLRAYDPAIAERFSILSRDLEVAGLRTDSRGRRDELSMDDKISLEEEARRRIKLAKDWEQLVGTIRNTPGFEDFLQPRKCADIMRRLPEEGPIVIINVHHDRCDALALMASASEPIHIPLPKFSYQQAERLSNGLRCYLHSVGVRLGIPWDDGDSSVPLVDFPQVLSLLWTALVSPILEKLAFFVCFFSFLSLMYLIIFFRALISMKSCPGYGGALLALLPSFQSMQQVSMIMENLFLSNPCLNLLSPHTFRP